MTKKHWFQLAVAILFVLIILVLFMQVSIIFYPLASLLDTLFIPLLFGGLLYYIALPFQTLLERNGLNRISSILIIILMFSLSIGIIGYFAVPIIVSESQKLISRFPEFQQELETTAGYIISQKETLPDFAATFIDHLIMILNDSFSGAITDVVGLVTNTISTLFMIIIIPLFLFFMLKDHEKFIPGLAGIFTGKLRTFIIALLIDIDDALKAFIQGQLMASIIRAVFLYIGFVLINAEYGILLVIIALFLNVIPFIGGWLTFIIVMIFTLVQSPPMMIWISVIFLVSYYVESKWFTPEIVTTQMKIHPLTVITLIIGSANLLGFWGMILSLPVYTVLRAVFINIYNYRHDIKATMLSDTIKR
ncbi:AI-2E family transporter [Salinicoccus sp. YB14-2]|uniref:AI-2E family transporter n=1 Tax=Salinicoccus sp. YB14-2 TaxID=1572701 RepID=UPI00068FE913|nr:AI-2E family transporter [Salinicoccus sp. YB14-2]